MVLRANVSATTWHFEALDLHNEHDSISLIDYSRFENIFYRSEKESQTVSVDRHHCFVRFFLREGRPFDFSSFIYLLSNPDPILNTRSWLLWITLKNQKSCSIVVTSATFKHG